MNSSLIGCPIHSALCNIWPEIWVNYFYILLSKSMRKASSLTFRIFFKWGQIVDWDVLISCANSWVLLRGLHSTNSLSWSKFGARPGLVSFLNDLLPEENFENQFRTCWPVMIRSPSTLEIFFTIFIAFFILKLPNMHFQFLHFRGLRSAGSVEYTDCISAEE